MLKLLGYSSRTGHFKSALSGLLSMGYLEMTVPESPRSKKQKYKTTERGKRLVQSSFVIRTEKQKAIDANGKPLFKPRQTLMSKVRWEECHHFQERLYEAVTDYVREGYNQAMLDKNRHIGFLMILMQRLVVSSTRILVSTDAGGEEQKAWQKDLEAAAQIIPEIRPLLLLKIEQGETHE